MPKYIRNYVAGGTYFFTLVTKNRIPIFDNEYAIEALLDTLKKTQTYHPFEILAFCILPDHVHLLLTLPAGVRAT